MELLLEAILFASGEPVRAERIAAASGTDVGEVFAAAERLKLDLEYEKRGIRLVRLEDSLQLISAPEYHETIRRVLETRRPPKLSAAALETLAVVAYQQPITRVHIDQIRGVDTKYTLSTLVERGLVEPCGKLDDMPGRPTLYRTTDLFMRSIGIQSLEQLKQFKPPEQITF
ncbi:MAG: SMC-Scp complex subunit ScpB [Oscillospiraceae bacterium]|jgi:segregation and condensation protein B|nr:SMC-Scp complex subunit ScpB [Oscillospiraceae bacterium]